MFNASGLIEVARVLDLVRYVSCSDAGTRLASRDLHTVRPLPSDTLRDLERTAVQLAQAAGEYIGAMALDVPAVQFKATQPGAPDNADPVSNVDREVEARLRTMVAERYPSHLVIGEESECIQRDDAPFIWVIDPLDGTTNYLNGLPLFAASVAVLYRHVPVAGAIWCASTHERHPGVYHAHHDGCLSFDSRPLTRRPAPPWRGLASEPGDTPRYAAFFETRVLASAALECAFAAAGILRVAYLGAPAIWDVAAGLVLARSAGCRVLTRRDGVWIPFKSFSAPNARRPIATLRSWRQPVLIGEQRAVDREAAVATALD
jgi:myo-inositol-1(or 4)-monophosphatase